MGYGNYSHAAHSALIADRAHQSRDEVFAQTQCHALMNPQGLKVREARDSADHPDSVPIAFALDVTGSMGHIPDLLARQELPGFMKLLQDFGIAHPQLLFMAIGDATSDDAPLQVGQFESTAELMDQWLTWSYLEGGGGGQNHESYELAFYIAAQHTDHDHWNQRGKKGYLFLTGDELPYPYVSKHQVGSLIGDQLDEDLPIAEVIAAAAERYHLYFLIPALNRRENCEKPWRQLLGDHVICLEDPQDTCAVAAALIAQNEGVLSGADRIAQALSASGMPGERIGAVIRAVEGSTSLFAAGDQDAAQAHDSPGAPAKPTSWWKKLFG
ncbi:hypothetical protein [Chitinilyticum aquatile]|uniref:hypothetical protein n=1 Tax=Chitinilyticum aquatile TaxID=362520 RepID=UPI00041497D1|nr:hypothetical protein [Chitinilyticum aquatile]